MSKQRFVSSTGIHNYMINIRALLTGKTSGHTETQITPMLQVNISDLKQDLVEQRAHKDPLCAGRPREVAAVKEGSIMTERPVLGLRMFVFPTTAGIYCRHWQGQPQ